MNPYLLISNGTPETRKILLNTDLLTIGRSLKNNLAIPDEIMSREHAVIKKTCDGFVIEDLSSHNGILVNSENVQNRILRHGDRIRIGQTDLLFLTKDDERVLLFSNQIQMVDDLSATKAEFLVSTDNNIGSMMTPGIHLLTKLGAVLDEIQNSEELQQKFLEIILEFIPAERGAVLLLNDDLNLPDSVCVLNRSEHNTEPMQISRSIVGQIVTYKNAVIVNESDQTNDQIAKSLVSYGVCSVLCVPLLFGEVTGLIYLDTGDISVRFDRTQLQQMSAIAGLLVAALKNIRYLEFLKVENKSLQDWAQIDTDMIGESEAMKNLSQFIGKVAKTDATVLIAGESGTGKELVARAIHRNSNRSHKSFITLNCAVLNENFLDSDLFGHEKGAFTGAGEKRVGKIELAEKGTLFLDEIGELAPGLQAKLLRVLQEREFERIGGKTPIKADIRLLTATNRNLKDEVKQGRFREDLFYRLNVLQIEVPPLRMRKTDIPLLVRHFIKKYGELCHRRITGIAREAQQMLTDYEWRGNIRELANVIERAVVLGSEEIIQIDDFPAEIIDNSMTDEISGLDYQTQIKIAKRKIIVGAIRESESNFTAAAQRLGIHPNNLHRLIRELELKEELTKN